MATKKDKELDFESSFTRLEEILENMNSGSISLDKSLELYEEADTLIHSCAKRLQNAEKKIETLIKSREGELCLDENSQPLKESFEGPSSNDLS